MSTNNIYIDSDTNLKGVIEKGIEIGYVTYDDINDILPIEPSIDYIDCVFH